MANELKGYVRENVMSWSERREILKKVEMITEDDIKGVCGNVFVACSTKKYTWPDPDEYFLYLVEPTTGRKQLLVDMYPAFEWNEEGPGELAYDEINNLVVVTEAGLSNTVAYYDPSAWKQVRQGTYYWGVMYAMEYVEDVLYGIFYPEDQPAEYHDKEYKDDYAAFVRVDTETRSGWLIMDYFLPTPSFHIGGLAYDRRNSELWGSRGPRTTSSAELVTIDVQTGKVTPSNIRITDFQNRTLRFENMEFGPDGKLYGIKSGSKLVTLSLLTGITRKVRDLGEAITGLSCITV